MGMVNEDPEFNEEQNREAKKLRAGVQQVIMRLCDPRTISLATIFIVLIQVATQVMTALLDKTYQNHGKDGLAEARGHALQYLDEMRTMALMHDPADPKPPIPEHMLREVSKMRH